MGVFKDKRILITGANGFLGSHIVEKMIENNANISIILRETSDLWRIEEYLENLNIYYIDLNNPGAIYNCVNTIKPEIIFHMAAYGVDSRKNDIYDAINTNFIGTVNLLSAVGKIGCEKFINTGTSMQYGNKKEIIDENTNYTPDNIYGSTKAAATIIAHQLAKDMDIDLTTIIPFGVFGEKEGSHKFFPQVILSILNGREVYLTSCLQYRDYCYVGNIINGFLKAAETKDDNGMIFNIGSGMTLPLKHYVELIIKEIGIDAKINYGALEYRKNDLWNPQVNVERIHSIINWHPEISIEDGIKRTISWYRNNYHYYDVRGR
ncbi:MAG: NAD(P)-dependent oxidoreductase [Lutispora sp.]|nr:NAD(P)-dependent oxidoreductase [Lutispora sp.]